MTMEMSARDKKLLVYLIALLIVAAAYFFAVRPFLDKNDALNERAIALESEVSKLTDIYNSQDVYAAKIIEEREKFEEALAKFPGGITQENTLMMLQDIEDHTGTWISRVTFSEEQVTSGSSVSAVDEYGEPVSNDTGGDNAQMSEVSQLSAQGISTIRQDLIIDYSCSYSNFKNFVHYIENNDTRLFISSLSAAYSPEANEVSGTVTLSQFAVEGAGKELEKPDLSGLSLGVDNIFSTLKGTTGSETIQTGTLNAEDQPAEGGGDLGDEGSGEETAREENIAEEDNGRIPR